MSAIKRRKTDGAGPPPVDAVYEDADTTKGDALVVDLKRFLWGNGGSCESAEIVEVFSKRLTTPEEKFAFRSILRQIASFDGKKWKLKTEFNTL